MKSSLDNLDIKHLRLFTALMQVRNVSGAALNLGITQPAASAGLRRLRHTFGDPLFVRSAYGMEPTPRAEAISGPIREVVDRLNRDVIGMSAFDPAETSTTFTIAMSDISEMALLPSILSFVRLAAPHATVRTVTPSPEKLRSDIESGSIDLALGYFPDLKGPNHLQQRLYSHSYISLLRQDHPLRTSALTLKQFLSVDHAMVHNGSRSQEILETFLKGRGIRPRVVLRASHFMSIPMIIAKTDLLATVPLAVGAAFHGAIGVRLVHPPFKIPRFVLRQHWHRRFNNDPRHRWLRTEVIYKHVTGIADEWLALDSSG